MTNRFRVFKVDDMYGVSDDSSQYTLAWDKSKLIMDNLCTMLNELNDANEFLRKDNLKIYGLLGSIRALLQNNKTKEAIQKINTLEKEITQ